MPALRSVVTQKQIETNGDKEVELIAACPCEHITDELSGELKHHLPGLDS